jgi:hypothetical protein
MNRGAFFLYCSDDLAFGFVSVLQECGLRLELVTDVSEQDRGRNLYPQVRVHSDNVTFLVRGFPPQPRTERNRCNGRNAILLLYRLSDRDRYSQEFLELTQTIKKALMNHGAELE